MKKIVKVAVAVMAIFAMTNFIACSTGGDSEGNTETEAGTGGSTGGTTGGETGGSTGGETGGSTGGTTGGETGGSTGGTTGGTTGGETATEDKYTVVFNGEPVDKETYTLAEATAMATKYGLVETTDYSIDTANKKIILTTTGMEKVAAAMGGAGEGDHDHTGEGGETGGEGDHDHTGEGGETGGEGGVPGAGEEPPIVITNPITLDFGALKKEIVDANLFTDSVKLTEDKTYVTSGVTLNFLASSKYAFKYNQAVGLTIKGDAFKITGIEGTYSAVVTWAIAGAKVAGERTLSVNNGTPVGNADTTGAASATSIDNLCTVENATGDLTFNASNEVVIKTIVITKI